MKRSFDVYVKFWDDRFGVNFRDIEEISIEEIWFRSHLLMLNKNKKVAKERCKHWFRRNRWKILLQNKKQIIDRIYKDTTNSIPRYSINIQVKFKLKKPYLSKDDVEGLRRIVRRLGMEGREGVVLKDPYNRVPPVKYTTGHANIDDLRLGMKFFFEEGRSFLFSRILREIFRAYEEEWSRDVLEKEALKLGLAILEPAIDAVRRVAEDKGLHEEYVLLFPGRAEMEEFEEYMSMLGVDIVRHQIAETEDGLRVLYKKLKETAGKIYEILDTGFSPLD